MNDRYYVGNVITNDWYVARRVDTREISGVTTVGPKKWCYRGIFPPRASLEV
jgi:hypothetical protein